MLRFLYLFIRLRSCSRALWVMDYEREETRLRSATSTEGKADTPPACRSANTAANARRA